MLSVCRSRPIDRGGGLYRPPPFGAEEIGQRKALTLADDDPEP
jgi:hypothetical protein